jgi:hypothetical protein
MAVEPSTRTKLNRGDFAPLFGVTAPGNDPQVNGVKVQCGNFQSLVVTGSAKIAGLKADFTSPAGFANGTAAKPGIYYTANSGNGFYNTGATIGTTIGGVPALVVSAAGITTGSVATATGNLVLNPAGSSIDCSGKTLINVGGLSINPNRYEVVSPSAVTTTGSTPTSILQLTADSGYAYSTTLDIVATTGVESASWQVLCRFQNNPAVSHVIVETTASMGGALAAAGIGFVDGAGFLQVNAVGMAATTIKWYCAGTVTRGTF